MNLCPSREVHGRVAYGATGMVPGEAPVGCSFPRELVIGRATADSAGSFFFSFSIAGVHYGCGLVGFVESLLRCKHGLTPPFVHDGCNSCVVFLILLCNLLIVGGVFAACDCCERCYSAGISTYCVTVRAPARLQVGSAIGA